MNLGADVIDVIDAGLSDVSMEDILGKGFQRPVLKTRLLLVINTLSSNWDFRSFYGCPVHEKE
jgi:hypothetical protein